MVSLSDEQSTVVTHPGSYEYSVRVNRWFLSPIGLWPKATDSTQVDRILSSLLRLVYHLLIVFTILPCFLYIFLEKNESVELRMKAIGPMSHWLMGELIYSCLHMRKKDIQHCLRQVKFDWDSVARLKDRELMLKNAKLGKYIACIAAFCMNLGVFTYTCVNGFRKITFHVGNESYSMYQLPCPFYSKLIDSRLSPINETFFIIQMISGFLVNCVTVGACGLAAVLATHACGQLGIVMSRLDELVSDKEEESTMKKLVFIVEHHLRTLSFITHIEKIMNLVCLVELIGCTMNLCMLEYYLLTEKSNDTRFSYAIIYVSMAFNIFIFCYIGEQLTEECKKVGEKAYMTDWYRLHHKMAASLILVISRSSITTKITAGKLVPVSIATFGDAFKTSFAYFNMLRTVAM